MRYGELPEDMGGTKIDGGGPPHPELRDTGSCIPDLNRVQPKLLMRYFLEEVRNQLNRKPPKP